MVVVGGCWHRKGCCVGGKVWGEVDCGYEDGLLDGFERRGEDESEGGGEREVEGRLLTSEEEEVVGGRSGGKGRRAMKRRL